MSDPKTKTGESGPNDQSAFLGLFLQEEMILKSFLLAATRDIHASDDLFQNVARVLWEKSGEYDRTRPFRGWALGVARLEVLKWKQGKARSREILSPEAISQVADAAEESGDWTNRLGEFLKQCLGELKSTARRVTEMKYGDSLSISEVASRVGKSVPAVEMILVRTRRVLRNCVQRHVRVEERN